MSSFWPASCSCATSVPIDDAEDDEVEDLDGNVGARGVPDTGGQGVCSRSSRLPIAITDRSLSALCTAGGHILQTLLTYVQATVKDVCLKQCQTSEKDLDHANDGARDELN